MASKSNQLGLSSESRYAVVGGPKGGSALDALHGSGPVLEACLAALLGRGDAMVIGRTRDSSAIFIRVLSGDGGGEWYEGSSSGLISTLEAIREAASS